jgi:signal transduction histidine kinase
MGKILAAKGAYNASLEHHLESLDYYEQRDNKLGKTMTTALLAQTYLLLKDYPKALRFAQQSLAMAREIKRKKEIGEAGKVLADIYEAKRDYHHALQYYKLYKEFSDSLFNEATRKQAFALETRHEYEIKEALLKDEAAKKDILQQHIDRNHALQIFIAMLLILFLTVVAAILFRSRADKHQTNLLLQDKNQEISRQKEEMEYQAVQLLLNNQQKDKLFSIIAHDLKGPLNSLKGLLDFLKENALSDGEISSMMAELRRNVDYSAELVSNLLFWASSQLNGIVVTPVVLHLQHLTAEIMALFIKQATDKKITLKNELNPSLTAYADKDMIQVIIRNLFSNAIKFCRPGDTITVTGRISDKVAEVCMTDTGIGIREDVLRKINRKESVTTYGTAKEKGTGLGMLLCREFAEENNGRFWIESQWGKGSRFYFTIP